MNTATLNALERAPLVLETFVLKTSSAVGIRPNVSLRRNRLQTCRKNAVEAVRIGWFLVPVTFVVNVVVRLLATLALIQRDLVCLWKLWATLPELGAVGETIISFGLPLKWDLNEVTVTRLQHPCVLSGPLSVSLGLR